MSVGHEQDIATFLTIDGKVFLAPQYNIAFDKEMNEGGTCPDFVALDFQRRHVVIVEVTLAASLKPLIDRVTARETRWFNPVRRVLEASSVINETWSMRFLGFVRQDNVTLAKRHFEAEKNVTFFPIEEATFSWRYWDSRMQNGLPW